MSHHFTGSGRVINFGGIPILDRKAEPPARKPPPESPFILGLDLGQTSDPTALAIIEREPLADKSGAPAKDARGCGLFRHDVVHLERFPLRTSYPEIVAAVKRLAERPELAPPSDHEASRPRLAIDATGVGRAVVDMFLGAGLPTRNVPITITSGEGFRSGSWNNTGVTAWWVAKRELVGAIHAGSQTGRLRTVPTLALAKILETEMRDFKVTITANAHETYNARGDGKHDDILLAVALALWVAENVRPRFSIMFG
jgi:hypothetical protein